MPGSTSSLPASLSCGLAVTTVRTAFSAVLLRSSDRVWTRLTMPQTARTRATMATIRPNCFTLNVSLRRSSALCCSTMCVLHLTVIVAAVAGNRRSRLFAAVNDYEYRGHEKQGREGGEYQPADDGAAQGSVLLAAFAQPESHRNHADDHRGRGHDDGAQAGKSGLESGLPSGVALVHLLAREADDEHAVRRSHAHAHDGACQRGHA